MNLDQPRLHVETNKHIYRIKLKIMEMRRVPYSSWQFVGGPFFGEMIFEDFNLGSTIVVNYAVETESNETQLLKLK